MSITADQEAAAAQALDSLDSDWSGAWVNVNSTISTFGAGGSKDAVLWNLQADRSRIDQLRGPLLDNVRNGSLTFDKWIATAQLTHDDIAYQQGLTSDWSLTSVLWNTVTTTAGQLPQIPQLISTAIPTWMIVAGFGVLGVMVLHYLSPIIGLAPELKKLRRKRR